MRAKLVINSETDTYFKKINYLQPQKSLYRSCKSRSVVCEP